MSDLLFSAFKDIHEIVSEGDNEAHCIENDATSNNEKNSQKLNGMLSFLNNSDIEDCEVAADKTITDNIMSNNTISVHQDHALTDDVPIKRCSKTYEKDKIKLYGESQRLLRETQNNSFKYKPKQFKTIDELKLSIQLKKEVQNKTKFAESKAIINKENLIDSTEHSTYNACDIPKETSDSPENLLEPRPLRERLSSQINRSGISVSNEVSQRTLPHKHRNISKSSQDIENILRKKNNNAQGFIELKSKDQYESAAKNRDGVLNGLKKAMFRPIVTQDQDELTHFKTIIKAHDPVTGVVRLESKTVTIKKAQYSKSSKIYCGMDPHLIKQIEARLSNEEMLKWRLMSPHQKLAFHRKLILKDVSDKRKELREKQIMDTPEVVGTVKKTQNTDNDGLSDDDFEFKVVAGSSSDSDADTTDSDEKIEKFDMDSDEEKMKKKRPIRIGFIEDDDDEEKDVQGELNPFVDDSAVVGGSENLTLDETYDEEINKVRSPTVGLRVRKRYENSPRIIEEDNLRGIKLLDEVTITINSLKQKYGLVNKLNGADSTMLLLPSMKTTTVCIENMFKREILTHGSVQPSTLTSYQDLLKIVNPTMKADWKHNFNMLSSLRSDNCVMENLSFNESGGLFMVNTDNSVQMTKSTAVDKVDMDVTSGMDADTLVHTPLPDTHIMDNDESSNSTVILPSRQNSLNEVHSFQSTLANNIHSKLFGFQDDVNHAVSDTGEKTLAQETFAHLSSLIKDCEDDSAAIDENIEKEESEGEDMDENIDEESEDEDIDDVDLDDSGSDNSDEESSKSGMEFVNEEDEEEILRENVKKGTKFIPREYIDEEAELSGSDAENYGSDEDERGLDEYEDEEGDKDRLPSQAALRRQIGLIHNKLEIDQDAHEIQFLKEMYMEDGDLNIGEGGPRTKRFTWEGLNNNDEFVRGMKESDDEDDGLGYEDHTSTFFEEINEEDQKKKEEEEEALLMSKYDRFLVSKRSVSAVKEDTQARSAWSTAVPVLTAVPVRPAVRKYGSMLNKEMRSLEAAKTSVRTINDLDLKSTMSVMYSNPIARQKDALKRGASFVQNSEPKKPRTNQY